MRIPNIDNKNDRNNKENRVRNEEGINKYKDNEVVNQYSETVDSYPQRDTFRNVIDSFTIGETDGDKDKEK